MKFDNVLFCSDWDGTLTYQKTINEKDIESIKYFQENGGKFTFCSGRRPEHFSDVIDRIRPNTYVIGLNGALIMDVFTGEKLYESFIDSEALAVCKTLLNDYDCFQNVCVHFDDEGSMILNKDEYNAEYERILKKNVYKVIAIAKSEEAVNEAMSAIKSLDLKSIVCSRSWITGFEFLSKKATKSVGMKILAKATGSTKLYAIGDYENDIDMIEEADFGFAVGNAIEAVKAKADKVLCPAWEGAISEAIKEIESQCK